MKATQYQCRVLEKNGEKYTHFTIGQKCSKQLLEQTIILLGGKLVKSTKLAKHYEIKGDQMRLMIVC